MPPRSPRFTSFALIWFAALSAAVAEPGQFSERWETLKGCQLVDNEWNDGDSFHIKHAGKEYIFRLYFVDTPETHDVTEGKARTTEQALYWKIRKTPLHELADIATAFSRDRLLRAPFTVHTRWEDAKGQSKLPRNFAVIETSSGDLADLLVSNGLARIHGHYLAHPNGMSAALYRKKLQKLEAAAEAAHLGAWGIPSSGAGKSRPPAKSAPAAKPVGDDIPAF